MNARDLIHDFLEKKINGLSEDERVSLWNEHCSNDKYPDLFICPSENDRDDTWYEYDGYGKRHGFDRLEDSTNYDIGELVDSIIDNLYIYELPIEDDF